MKVFLDTNILIDVLEARADYKNALVILQMGLDARLQLCATDLSFINTAYISRKAVGMDRVYDFLAFVRNFVDVIPVGSEPIDLAIAAHHKDFEDYVQYAAAKGCGADCIVTRNIKDFGVSDIKIFGPDSFLHYLESGMQP